MEFSRELYHGGPGAPGPGIRSESWAGQCACLRKLINITVSSTATRNAAPMMSCFRTKNVSIYAPPPLWTKARRMPPPTVALNHENRSAYPDRHTVAFCERDQMRYTPISISSSAKPRSHDRVFLPPGRGTARTPGGRATVARRLRGRCGGRRRSPRSTTHTGSNGVVIRA
jgi:hypothetical protein